MSIYKTPFKVWDIVDEGLPLVNQRYRFGDSTFAYWPSEAAAYKEIEGYGTTLVGKGCKRRIWYRFNDVPYSDPMLAEGYYKAMMGKVCESFIFDALNKKHTLLEHNIKFYSKKYNISGEIDALIQRPDNDHKVIVELKTFDGYFASKNIMGCWDSRGKGRSWIKGQPKDEHLLQAFLYDVLNNDNTIDFVKLMYLARDTVVRTEFDVSHTTVDNTLYPVVDGQVRKDINGSKMLERYELYNLIVSQDTLPDRDYSLTYEPQDIEKRYKAGLIFKTSYEKHRNNGENIGDYECSYCPYKSHCYKLGGK
jgi:hypothetical protein